MTAAYLLGPEVEMPRDIGCASRNTFSSEADAKSSARRAGLGLKPVACPHCSQWHLAPRRRRLKFVEG